MDGIAQKLVPIPGHDPDIEQRILPVLHSVGQVERQGIGQHQAEDSEQQQRCGRGSTQRSLPFQAARPNAPATPHWQDTTCAAALKQTIIQGSISR
jgi:hypothetical protein